MLDFETADLAIPYINSYSVLYFATFNNCSEPVSDIMQKEIGIFPAAGGLGGSTYRHLLKLIPSDRVTLICRHPEKLESEYKQIGVKVRRATYESTPQELELAFSGLDVLFLISYPSHVHDYRVKVRTMQRPTNTLSRERLLLMRARSNFRRLMLPDALG